MRLPNAQELPCCGLGQATFADETIYLQGKLCPQQLPFGMGQAQIREEIPGALLRPRGFGFRTHLSSAFRDAGVRPPQGDAVLDPAPDAGWRCRVSISSGRHAARRKLPPSKIRNDLDHGASAENLHRPGRRIEFILLCRIEGHTDVAPNRAGKGAHILPGGPRVLQGRPCPPSVYMDTYIRILVCYCK